MTDAFGHPWLGGLFGDAEAAEALSPGRQLGHMLAFEAAHARALGAAGRVPAREASRLADAIEGFTPDMAGLRAGTARDGVPVPALVAQMKAALGDSPALHRGATSQDVVDTALALTLRDVSDLLDARLARLSDRLDTLARRFGDGPLMGRTRMQAALPIAVGDRIATWSLPLHDHRDRLRDLRPRVELLQLGGAVGDGAPWGGDREDVAADMATRLRLHVPPRAWHAMRAGIADYGGLLSLVTGASGKMGQDVCLMAQLGEIALDGGGASSAMPHKRNPVAAEALVTLARFNATQVSGLHHALVHEQERSGAAWALEWMILPQMAMAAARSLAIACDLCDGVVGMGRARDG